MKKYKIAVLPGDGIGKEVIPEAKRVLQTAVGLFTNSRFEFHELEAGGEYYLKHNKEWSEETEGFVKKQADAVLLGAVGALDENGKSVLLPDGNLAGYSVVIGLRFNLNLYANVRPVKLFPGVHTPLALKKPEDIDLVIIRENTEGLYAPIRGRMARTEEEELAIDVRVITRKAAERVIRYSFELADRREGTPEDGQKKVTCVDKSNLLEGCRLFRKVFDEVSKEYPNIKPDYAYVDAFVQWVIRQPESFDVAVAPNEFGDIITDLGGAIQGGLGMAPSGNIGDTKGVFEPVHGSAPKHYGHNRANPMAAILSAGMMLDWLGEIKQDEGCKKAARAIHNSVASVLSKGDVRTYDLCVGNWSNITPSTTQQVGQAVIDNMKRMECA